VLSNHKMVHESLCKSYGYQRIELMPGLSGSVFQKSHYEKMISILYEEPQYLSVMLRKAETDEVDRLVSVICDRIYANHYKARDEYYILALIMHATGEDMSNITEPTNILSQVNYVTKIMAAYTRRGPNTEALKEALFKPLSLVLARKKLELEIDPSRVYAANLEYLRFKIDPELEADRSPQEAWKLKEVRDIVLPRVKNLLEITELFLTRVIAARGVLPYGVRAIAHKVYEMAQDRFPKADDVAKMAGVANFVFTSFLCPAIIQPEAFDLCSPSSRPSPHMKRNLLRIATTLKAIGSLKAFDDQTEPWMAEISAKIKGSIELMKQFYANLCDVPELEDQRRVTMYMESTESRSPTRAFELNSLYLVHSVLYRHHAEIVSSSDNPLTAILRDLGNMPDQVSYEQNKQVRTLPPTPASLDACTHPRRHISSRTGHGRPLAVHRPCARSPLHAPTLPRLSRPLVATRERVAFAACHATSLILSATAVRRRDTHTGVQRPLPPVVPCLAPAADLTVSRPHTGRALSAVAATPEQNRCGECAVMGVAWRRASGLMGRGTCAHNLPIGRPRMKLAAPHNYHGARGCDAADEATAGCAHRHVPT
jgi:hypothetical protein